MPALVAPPLGERVAGSVGREVEEHGEPAVLALPAPKAGAQGLAAVVVLHGQRRVEHAYHGRDPFREPVEQLVEHLLRARARLDPRRMARLAGKWWGRRA